MSFLSYESTRSWAKAMKTAVATKKMPPSALLAVAILATSDPALREKLKQFRADQTAKILKETL